jgi:CheY-like chemotaxis protein
LDVAPFLIVDDNYINLKLLATYLSRKSYPFVTAVDGILAVEAYRAGHGNFSCIFMDIQMPRMDGITATRAIREYERQQQLPAVIVVAMTGLASEEKQREAEASGVNVFLAKPVKLKALDGILERAARTVGDLSKEDVGQTEEGGGGA